MAAIPLPIGCNLFSTDVGTGSGEVLGVAVYPSLSLDSMMGSLGGMPYPPPEQAGGLMADVHLTNSGTSPE